MILARPIGYIYLPAQSQRASGTITPQTLDALKRLSRASKDRTEASASGISTLYSFGFNERGGMLNLVSWSLSFRSIALPLPAFSFITPAGAISLPSFGRSSTM